jgi:hypothetical protein
MDGRMTCYPRARWATLLPSCNGADRWTAGWPAEPAQARIVSWRLQWSRPLDGRMTYRGVELTAELRMAAMEPADDWPGDLPGQEGFADGFGAAMEPADVGRITVAQGGHVEQVRAAAMEPTGDRPGDRRMTEHEEPSAMPQWSRPVAGRITLPVRAGLHGQCRAGMEPAVCRSDDSTRRARRCWSTARCNGADRWTVG